MKSPITLPALPENRQFIAGLLLGVTGSFCFAAKAVFVKMAYHYGITALPLLTLRLIFATPFYLFALWLDKTPWVTSKRDIIAAIICGFLGNYVSSLLDFMGLAYISVGLERLTLFLYPSFIIILSALLLKIPVKRSNILSLAVCYVGILLAFTSEMHLSTTPEKTLLGTLLVITSAFSYSFYMMGNGVYGKRLGTIRFTALTMLSGTIAIITHYLMEFPLLDLTHYPPEVYVLSFTMATVSTVFASFMITIGISYIGAGLIGIIGTIGPVFTLGLGAIFLSEPLTLLQLAGMVLVILGVVSVKK